MVLILHAFSCDKFNKWHDMNSIFFNLSNRKRELLAELLTDKFNESMISKKELHELNKAINETNQLTDTTPQRKSEKTEKTTLRKKISPKKKKTTCYLAAEVLENLNNATKEIQSVIPAVLQSQVINSALALMLEEYKTRGKNSRLVRSLLHVN